MSQPPRRGVVPEERARQARRAPGLLWVLGASLILVVIVFFIIWMSLASGFRNETRRTRPNQSQASQFHEVAQPGMGPQAPPASRR